jgi:hypothetical protein
MVRPNRPDDAITITVAITTIVLVTDVCLNIRLARGISRCVHELDTRSLLTWGVALIVLVAFVLVAFPAAN